VGLSGWLGRLAAAAPVPVFGVAGGGAREAIQDLRLRPELGLVDAPASASVLVVAGAIPDALRVPLCRIHDVMPHPRATLLWSAVPTATPMLPGLADPVLVSGDPVPAALTTYRQLVAGDRPSEPPLLPDIDPAPWRGVGPYGQGGTGMTGGVPYGRPMAELGADPDGLRLDVLPATVGPFYHCFPPGLLLDVRWAGDLVLEAKATGADAGEREIPARPGLRPFLHALREPVAIAELELSRAREHLRWVAEALRIHGLAALGCRALRLAGSVRPGDAGAVLLLARLVRLARVNAWSARGVGRLAGEAIAGLGVGPVARATGLLEDVRLEDPSYRALGFEPLTHGRGDAAARMELRLHEAAQSLELAARAGDRHTRPAGRVESPRGRLDESGSPTERLLPLLPELLSEVEWGDVVTTLVSLDLDLEEGPLARSHRSTPVAA
jgi:hypothetical protein